jgi:diguanylate cyclase (GGDEF)-like protein
MLTPKTILNQLATGVAILHNGTRFSDVNSSFKALMGLDVELSSLDALVQSYNASVENKQALKNFLETPQSPETIFKLISEAGKTLGLSLKSLPSIDNDKIQLLTIQDLTQYEARIRQLVIESEHDELTGIANRRKFEREFERNYEFTKRSGTTGALLLFDIDRFKSINDRFGHPYGDHVLKLVGSKVMPLIRNYEMLARVGGDEFAILVAHSGPMAVQRLIKHLPVAISSIKLGPPNSNQPEEVLQITMGYSLFSNDGQSKSDIYKVADRKLYESKQSITRA